MVLMIDFRLLILSLFIALILVKEGDYYAVSSSGFGRLTSSWTSWRDRYGLYKDLKPGDILQKKIDGYFILPGMEHWVLFLGFADAEQKHPLIVHLVNNDPASSFPSGWSVGSVGIGGSIISGGLSSNSPLVSSGSAALSPSATSISGGLSMSSGGIICGSALAPYISGLGGLLVAEKAAKVLALVFHGGIGVFLLAGGGMILTSAASSYMSPRSSPNPFSSSNGNQSAIQWVPLENIWQPGKEFRKHNFKDTEWTPAGMDIILERVDSEYRAAKPYSLFKNNCEQFVHYCRYGKRYSGQVAAFSKNVRWWTLGLVRIFDEFD